MQVSHVLDTFSNKINGNVIKKEYVPILRLDSVIEYRCREIRL